MRWERAGTGSIRRKNKRFGAAGKGVNGMSKGSGYAGKVSSRGGQVVKAVYPAAGGKSGKVSRGEDLRDGKKSKE